MARTNSFTKNLGSFRDINIWRDAEVTTNGLAPLAPVLNLIVYGTLAACEDFAATLARTFKWHEPIVPGMKLYMRGYYNKPLKRAFVDSDSRLAEVRSLIPGVRHGLVWAASARNLTGRFIPFLPKHI